MFRTIALFGLKRLNTFGSTRLVRTVTILEVGEKHGYSPHAELILRVDAHNRHERCQKRVNQVGVRIARQLVPLLGQLKEEILSQLFEGALT